LRFVVRGDAIRRVRWEGRERRLSDLLPELEFSPSREVDYHGAPVTQFVATTQVVLHRPAQRHQIRAGRHLRKAVRGRPLELRLVVSELRDAQGEVLARWLLWTNVLRVPAATIAQWYYWRWKIESCFKLLKSAGQHVEQWQQTSATAIAKRLLVAAAACVVVWRLARSTAPRAVEARALLVRLSGRLMQRGKEFTEPALLAGMWVLLGLLDTLERHTLAEIKELAGFILPTPLKVESG